MTCRELIGFLADYLDGELPDAVRADFERHLALCPECVVYLDGYRDAIRLSRDAFAPDGPPPDDVPEALVEAILAAKR